MFETNPKFKSKVLGILKEEEFSDIISKISEQVCSDIASDIVNQTIHKDVTDDEIRNDIREYFADYFISDAEKIKNISDNIQDNSEYDQFGVYNEQMDRFNVVFKNLDLPKDQKKELFDSVVSISNYSAYNLMLLRTLSNAIYNTLDGKTANDIIQKALFGVSEETILMMEEIGDNKELQKVEPSEEKRQTSNVIPFSSHKTDDRLMRFK